MAREPAGAGPAGAAARRWRGWTSAAASTGPAGRHVRTAGPTCARSARPPRSWTRWRTGWRPKAWNRWRWRARMCTGSHWHELLEERGFEVLLVNARQLKNVPGRKTDMLDCQWLQRLHSCGLLRGSFRPPETVTQLRALHRQWQSLVAERTRCVQWMQRALDQMNVQVHRAVTDLTGQTGMAIVRAIVAGQRDAEQLAQLRSGRCKHTEEAVRGVPERQLAGGAPVQPAQCAAAVRRGAGRDGRLRAEAARGSAAAGGRGMQRGGVSAAPERGQGESHPKAG